MAQLYAPSIEEMEKEIEHIWENVRKDWIVNQRYNIKHHVRKQDFENVFRESDVKFLFVHHIKLFTDKYPRLQIYTEESYHEIGRKGKGGRPDIIIENSGKPWFVFEIKVKPTYNQLRAKKINNDRIKLTKMNEYGIRRAYFCYITGLLQKSRLGNC